MVGSDPTPSGAPLVGLVLGKYKLVRLLGEGGMGAVYEAVHQELGRRAAVKTLLPRYAASESVRQRFLREGQSAARIRHPNVADVYDVGVDGNHPYLVMEYLEGEDLGRLLAREGPLSPQRTSDLLLPVIAAVAAAHDAGIIHRDLKPDNIFLASERGAVRSKVLDFGISKLKDSEDAKSLTGTGALLGTPYYMSPEQARAAKHVDSRSDQYSLGVILYECVTKRRPIEEPSLYSLIQRIVRGDFPPPRELNPRLPAPFEQVILRAMARNPGARYATARALGAALLEFASEPTRAQYAEEFQPSPGDSAPGEEALWAATTLGESSIQPSPVRPRRGTALRWSLGGFGAACVAGFAAWRAVSPLAPAPSAASSPPAAISLPVPTPSVHPEITPPPASPIQQAPLKHKKLISSVPTGATVWADGRELGKAPFVVDVLAGTPVELELRLSGHATRKQRLTEADPDAITVELSAQPRPAHSSSTSGRRPSSGVARPHTAPNEDPPSLAPR